MNHFIGCDICGAPGHGAKKCGLNRLEAQRDPVGELARVEAYRQRARDRAKQQQMTNQGSPQTSRGFGL